MKHKKVLNLLNEANDSKFATRKLSMTIYGVGNKVNYNTEFLKSNLCEYNNAYIIVKGNITVTGAPEIQVTFRNCAPFTKSITKMNGTTINDAENLDLVMPMYNLIEYTSKLF